ncbi:hypothetical protein [Neorhizobium sp. IRS_2294]|uniref:hypothetical protein n=1 Tax=unclassified Neorhizobium TaxID=2629175 RepID=UPI003D2A7AD7
MRILTEITKIVVGVLSGAALVIFFNINFHFAEGATTSQPLELTYADLAAINLTVATVVLGGVALIVAVAAVFGFQIIRTESVSNAETRVRADLPDMVERELGRMEKDGRLSNALERAIYSGGSNEDGDDGSSPRE